MSRGELHPAGEPAWSVTHVSKGRAGRGREIRTHSDTCHLDRLRRSGEIGKVSPAMLMQGVLFKAAGCIFLVFVHARRPTRSTRVGRTWPKTGAGKCGFKTEHGENTVNQRRHCNVIGISPLLLSRNAPSPSVEMTKRGVRGEQRGLMLLRLKTGGGARSNTRRCA